MINNYNYSSYDQYGMNVMETVGPVALIAMPGSVDFVNRINSRLYKRRLQYLESNPELLYKNPGFMRESYLIDANLIRFASGEGKATLDSTVRGYDLYLITDFLNHSITYDLFEQPVPMSPDDHFQDLVRVILACSGKARRINVIMPYLYESRQSVRVSRESLDCAYMLNELKHLV